MPSHVFPSGAYAPPVISAREGGRFLWVDLRRISCEGCLYRDECGAHRAEVVVGAEFLPTAIEQHCPLFLVFEYDAPDRQGLNALEQSKQRFPRLPILMLTEAHSEALAVWALRTRVWDYLVKPLPAGELEGRLAALSRIGLHAQKADRREVARPQGETPGMLPAIQASTKLRTAPAIAYIHAFYSRRIELDALASLCRLSPSTFSRTFHDEHGVTLRDYLVRYRVERARERMSVGKVSLKELALSVGFCDHSHFTRAFQKVVGVCPGRYATAQLVGQKSMAAEPFSQRFQSN